MLPEPVPFETRPRVVSFGPFHFDSQNRLLSKGGTEIPLPPRVLGVLELLLSRPGEIVPRRELLERVWKDAFVTDTSLAEAISFLRQALEDDPQAPRYIQTIHRRGYRFLSPATSVSPMLPTKVDVQEERVSPTILRDLAPWTIATVCAVLATVALWRVAHDAPPDTSPVVVRFEAEPVDGTFFDRRSPAFAASPNGDAVVWSACEVSTPLCALYVRQLDRIEPVRIKGSEGARAPFFSPDGRWIGFFADGKLKKTSIGGGSVITLADAPAPGGASWNENGLIVFAGAPAGGLAAVSDQGGDVRQLTKPRFDRGEMRHLWPSWLPEGRGVLFSIAGAPQSGLPSDLGLLPTTTSPWHTLRRGVSRGIPIGHGYVAVSTMNDVQVQTFDERTQTLGSASEAVLAGLATAQGTAQFTVGSDGTFAAVSATNGEPQLAWADAPSRLFPNDMRLRALSISPDGRRAVGVRADNGASEIRMLDLENRTITRLTYAGVNAAPIWTHDGQVIFATRADGPFAIAAAATGATPAVVLTSNTHVLPGSTSVDGQFAVVKTLPEGRFAIGIAPRIGAEPVMISDGPFDEVSPVFSPDAAWLAFASDESGRWEVYVRHVRDGRRFVVSAHGGERPSWSSDGRWIYFHEERRLLRSAFDARREQPVATPEVVFDRPNAHVVAVAPNGRLLIEQEPVGRESAVVVLRWLRELRQRLPPPVVTPR